ncbi:TYR [Branchiostoma lanceolatum]|uniref:Tyrosinase n=1 Tax=Branchiostoma lanceolatum TaxID=7740 RepID=A0A8K0EZA9_BRALA|nr:TYR [Branchiostoma lanceolatum]
MQTAELVVLYVVVATLAHVTEAQFPRVCTTVDHLRSKECCPVPGGYTQPCGGPGRGSCQVIPDGTMKVYDYKPNWVRDDRSQWPKLFFNRSCTCEFPFSGYDCSKCVWGRYGSACDVTKTIVRKNVKGLSSEDRFKYQTYLNRAKTDTSDYVVATEFYDTMVNSSTSVIDPSFVDVSVYDFLVWMHYYASRETILPEDNDICKVDEDCEFDTAHDAVGFLTWHRGFLLEMERFIQEVNSDPDWAIPYWDWTASEQCDICTNDFVGANDDSGNLDSGSAFSGWEALCEDAEEQHGILKPCDPNHRRNPPLKLTRNPGGQDKYGETLRRLPRREEVDFALRFATFDNSPFNKTSDCVFRNLVEGYADTRTGKYRPDIIGPDGENVVPGAHTLHNHVHIYLHGTMSAVPTSSNDPIFWLHHASIDRIFEKWLRKYKSLNKLQRWTRCLCP